MAFRESDLMGGNADGVSVGYFEFPHSKLPFRRYQNIWNTERSRTF